jgi:DNA-binding transcriptional LysR family regulator
LFAQVVNTERDLLEIHQLRIFLAVWELRSFSAAARKVYLTQPTVSGHIKGLEDALKVRLFDRSGRDVVPTKAGELLYPFARKIVGLVSETEEEVAAFLGGGKGVLTIGGSTIPGQYILPRVIAQFRRDRPEVRVVLRIGDTAGITDLVGAMEMDLAIVGAVLNRQGLAFEPIYDDQLVLVVPKGHRLAGKTEADVAEIRAEPFVVRERGSGTRLVAENALKAAGAGDFDAFNVVAEVGSTEAVRHAVKAGLGLAIVSRRAVEDDVGLGLLSALAIKGIDLNRRFYLIWRKNRTLPPVALDFCNLLRSGSNMRG